MRNGEHWRAVIADNGIGMTPQQQAALFQPFNRLGREKAGIPGTGLGLVIARDLVQAMGGRLAVRSATGQGSEFMVDLLAADAGQPTPADPARGSDLRVRVDVTGRVLCVEDDPASRELISSVLDQRPGIQREIVQTGAACIAAARRQWPNLLLLDLRLPDMPGLDVLKVLRQLNPHLPLQCLVVSADGAADDVAASRAAGADAHLAKPIDPGRLLPIIDRLLARSRQHERMPGDALPSPDVHHP
jgi:CheY-like chemotaxis protein